MALAVVAARVLGPVEFGHYSYAFAIGFLLGELADLGLHFFLARQVAEDPTAAIGGFVRAKLVLVLSLGAAGFVVGLTADPDSPRRILVWLLTAAWLLASSVEMLNQVFRGLQRLEREAAVSIAMAVVAFGLGTAALVAGLGARGLAVGLIAGHLLALALAVVLAARVLDRRQWRARGSSVLGAGVVRQAGPLALAMIASRLYFQIDLLMLGGMDTARAVGDMGVVQRFLGGAMLVSGVVQAAVFPAFAASRSAEARRRLTRLTFIVLMTAGALGSAAVWWLGAPLVDLVFGPAYPGAVLPLQILVTGLVWMLPEYAIGPLLFAAHQERPYAILWIATIAAIALGDLWAVPAYGAIGAALVKVLVTSGLVAGEVVVLWRVRHDLGTAQ
jgi:O-antigen/teichoic acid export membrane protein